jgi:hypothetical protein
MRGDHVSAVNDPVRGRRGVRARANEKWINYQMMQGKGLRDVGQLEGMPPSEFYDMELDQVRSWGDGAGYPGHVLDPQP